MRANHYKNKLRELSDALVTLQKPILILDAIKWPNSVQDEFFAKRGREFPAIDHSHYQAIPLSFDPETKMRDFKELKEKVTRELGKSDRLGAILKLTIEQYLVVIEMLRGRGAKEFMRSSQALYGSASEKLHGGSQSLIELGERLCQIFSLPAAEHLKRPYPNDIPADIAVNVLGERLKQYFADTDFQVQISDGIVSDASAGGDCIKMNANAKFSMLDLQVLEVHEGWVHVGTTLNGRQQPYASWLSIGSPRITAAQEGLAVLIETLTFSSYPGRARRISDRVVAIEMAENGADFIEVYNHFLQRGLSEKDCYRVAQRVFRGGDVRGGVCFTKDLSYVKGFVETVNFIKSAILSGVPEVLPMMFAGKVTFDDVPVLYEYMLEGLVLAPKHLPPMFRDLNGLFTWFGFSSGISQIDIDLAQKHFEKIFANLPLSSPIISHLSSQE